MLKKVLTLLILLNYEIYKLNGQEISTCLKAKLDAEKDINSSLWFFSGFLLSFPTGFPLLSFLLTFSPPSSRFVGKSPEYIEEYLRCYSESSRKEKLKYALYGCVTSAILVSLIIYLSHRKSNVQGCVFPSIDLGGCSSSSSGCSSSGSSSCSSSGSSGCSSSGSSGCSSSGSSGCSSLNSKTTYYILWLSLLLSSHLLK